MSTTLSLPEMRSTNASPAATTATRNAAPSNTFRREVAAWRCESKGYFCCSTLKNEIITKAITSRMVAWKSVRSRPRFVR